AKMTEILEIFSLLLNTDKIQKCQTDNKKSSKSFSDLLLLLAAGGGMIFSFLWSRFSSYCKGLSLSWTTSLSNATSIVAWFISVPVKHITYSSSFFRFSREIEKASSSTLVSHVSLHKTSFVLLFFTS